jgi:sugar lactone lactonase YvrE
MFLRSVCFSSLIFTPLLLAPGVFASETVLVSEAASPNPGIKAVAADGTVTDYASVGFTAPMGMAVDHSGNIYVACFVDNTVRKITPQREVSVFASGLNRPSSVALDAADNVYVGGTEDSLIWRFSGSGAVSLFAEMPERGILGLAFDSAGNLYASSFYESKIYRITPAGGQSVFVGSDPVIAPFGLAMDKDDNLYVANNGDDKVLKVTPAAAISVVAAFPHLSLVQCVTVDTNGNVYAGLASSDLHGVFKIDPAGTVTTLTTAVREPGGLLVYSAVDTESPTIQCPPAMAVDAEPGQCSAVVTFTVTAADNSDPAPVVSATPPSGSRFPVGTTVVQCLAVDASGNSNTCSFTITVNDRVRPVVQCPTNMVLPCGVSLLTPAFYSVTATDNCDPAPLLAVTPPSGSGFPVGTTQVTAIARDESGNAATNSFTITRAALGFTGFLAPISGADATGGSFAFPLRTFRVGKTIPIEFTASCDGAYVLTGIHTLQLVKYSDATNSDPPIDAVPPCTGSTGNQFRLAGHKWFFNLDTRATGITPGKWKLVATLSDGSTHFVWLQFKR